MVDVFYIILAFAYFMLFVATLQEPDPNWTEFFLSGFFGLWLAYSYLLQRSDQSGRFRLTPEGLFVKRFLRRERMTIRWVALESIEYDCATAELVLKERTGREYRLNAFLYGNALRLRDALMRFAPDGIEPPQIPEYVRPLDLAALGN